MLSLERKLFVTGIGTGVGKTVVSAILVEALKAAYWKPVQAGDLSSSDTLEIRRLCGNLTKFFPERFRLSSPLSPHAAAAIDGITIDISDFSCPECNESLVIEGAGGLLVPLSASHTIADLIAHLKAHTILVSRHYLGSINHTLLSIAELTRRNLPVAGLIFVGDENQATESVITQHPIVREHQMRVLGRVPLADKVDQAYIQAQALSLLSGL